MKLRDFLKAADGEVQVNIGENVLVVTTNYTKENLGDLGLSEKILERDVMTIKSLNEFFIVYVF